MTENYRGFPYSDKEIIKGIEKDGIVFFGNHLPEMYKNTSYTGVANFKKYLRYYLFESFYVKEDSHWDLLASNLFRNKGYLSLIDFIDEEVLKEKFVVYISLFYKNIDIEKIFLERKITPYFVKNMDTIIKNMVNNKCLYIEPYMRDKEIRKPLLGWFDSYYQKNKHYKNLDGIEIYGFFNLTLFFRDITYLTMKLYDYYSIIVKSPLYKNDNEHQDHIFCLIHDFMELSVLNFNEAKETLEDIINETKHQYDETPGDSIYMRDILSIKIAFFHRIKANLQDVTINTDKCVRFFSDYSVDWLYKRINDSSHSYDSILINTITYLYKNRDYIYFHDKLFDVCMKIIDSDKDSSLTASPYIRKKTVSLIAKNYENPNTCLKMITVNNVDIFVKNLTHMFAGLSSDDEIQTIGEFLILLEPYKEIIFMVADDNICQKFVHIMIDVYMLYFDEMISYVKKFYNTINGFTESDVSEETILSCIMWHQNMLFVIDYFLQNKNFSEACSGVGTRESFSVMLGKKLHILCGEEKKSLHIMQDHRYFNPRAHLKNTFHVLYLNYKNRDIAKAVIQETQFVKTEHIRKMINILLRKNEILVKEFYEIEKFAEMVENEREKEEQEKNREIPDELLDPIMGCLIENPVLLPETDIYMERDIILRHLLTSEDNPFNREPLTKSQLEEFNRRPDIAEKIKLFQEKISKYL